MTKDPKYALIIAMSMIPRDPRVRRQLDSLASQGWTVDTIGVGPEHDPAARDHFALNSPSPWVRSKLGAILIHGFLPNRAKFKLLESNQIPFIAHDRIRSGHYQLIIFNDHHFMPWIADPSTFTQAALQAHIHLDLHEYFPPRVLRDTFYRRFTAGYNDWRRNHIGDRRFTTRSTPVRGISALYASEFGFDQPAVVRSCPPAIDQQPSPVNPREIRLLYHGVVNPHRGVFEMVDAMRLLDDRFTMTFMSVGSPQQITNLKAYAHGMEDRVHFVPPVQVEEISSSINKYDLEVMFFPWHTTNLKLALPNKFFEALQGRLGVVIGDSPMMQELVDEHHLGLVVRGWSAEDLAAGINTLSAEQVAGFKRAAHVVSPDFSAESERQAFLAIVEPSSKPRTTRD